MKKNSENAAERYSYIGYIFKKGEKQQKKEILASIANNLAEFHEKGYIHIHDLDAYGLTYNCLAFNIHNNFPYHSFKNLSNEYKIIKLFNYYKDILTKIGNEQSGGEAFANFDIDTAIILENLNVENNQRNISLIKDCISELIYWCNNCHDRIGMVAYYVTLNIGLANTDYSYNICKALLEAFYESSVDVFKPNIVFKVKRGINLEKDSPNYLLLKKALECSSKKMIPTYLFCDCKQNALTDPLKLAIMGCRTRVVDDIFGEKGSVGRGNIANISINLPKLALEIINSEDYGKYDNLELLKNKWLSIAIPATEILIDRYNRLINLPVDNFPSNKQYQVWIKNFQYDNTLEEVFKHGTLSLGFIGLSEAIEILTEKKFYLSDEAMKLAYEFVKFMRSYTDECIKKYNLNFSLLAPSGELISGRFPEIDSKLYDHYIFDKGYYTNSFHVDVDSRISGFEKISKEAPFHELSNGGCITYIEIGEAPIGNSEGLEEYVNYSLENNINYLGFNFPLDFCNDCNNYGIFDKCPNCESNNIKRIRRVSGYLEVLDNFTNGKYNETNNRRLNHFNKF